MLQTLTTLVGNIIGEFVVASRACSGVARICVTATRASVAGTIAGVVARIITTVTAAIASLFKQRKSVNG